MRGLPAQSEARTLQQIRVSLAAMVVAELMSARPIGSLGDIGR